MNRAIDDLIESARLFGGTQAKRGFGVYTQDDAIMERAFWEGVEARAKAIRDEVVALKAERDELLAALKAFSDYVHTEQCSTDGKVTYSDSRIQPLVFKARDAIAKAEGEKP